MMADYRNALDPIDMGGYSPEQAWRGRYRVPQGGVLDTLPDDAPMPSDPVQRNALRQAYGLVNHYTGGGLAAFFGLGAAAIPGMPFGDMWSAVNYGKDAADEFAANGRGARDLLSLPDAFAGSVPGGVGYAAARGRQPGKEVMTRKGDVVSVKDSGLGPPPASFPERIRLTLDEIHNRYEANPQPLLHTLTGQEKKYHVTKNGDTVGHANITTSPYSKNAFINWMQLDRPVAINDLARSFQESEPNVSGFFGNRSSGAKFKSAKESGSDLYPLQHIEFGAPPPPEGMTGAEALYHLATGAAAQAGRGIDKALTSAVRAMPDNAVGSAGGKLSAPSPAGIRAYHGSPHDFDKFDLSKIGTGEGAQAYGHGLYFAENDGVARSYRDSLTRGPYDSIKIGDNVYTANTFGDKDPVGLHAFQLLKDAKGDAKYAKEVAGFVRPEYREAAKKVLDDWEKQGIERAGRMYEVRINADPADFLDWDAPLSKQSEKVREAIGGLSGDGPVGNQLVNALQNRHFTDRLSNDGVAGIKYLDQGSRTAGEGSRNYVVFDDKIIDILRKYGIAGTMVAGGGMAVSSSDVEAHPALIPLLMGTAGLMAGGLSNDADRAELMLNRQSPRLYDYAPQPGMLNALAPR